MGGNPGIEQILGKLVELLTAKKDEVPSSSKETVPHMDAVQKLELMPTDIKLEGIKNYFAWSRWALLLLKASKLENFINEEITEPEDKSSSEWKTWDATNSLVAAWLLNSMSPTIAASVDAITTASGIWAAISKMYSGAGNVMLLAETDDKIYHLKQGELSLMGYVAELKRLWADLDHYEPINLPHPECVAWVKKYVEKRRVLQFLRGLNPEFEARRAAIFHQSNLPSLEDAIAAMAQEESRLKIMKGCAPSPPSPAFVVTRSQETRICYNCDGKGHLSQDCSQPQKTCRGRGRGNDRGAPRGGAGRGGRRGYRANFAMSEEGASDLVSISANELEELRRMKENKNHSKLDDQRAMSNSTDSGASRHGTGMSSEFTSYTPYSCSHKETIQTAEVIEKEPNRNFVVEKGRGTPLKEIPTVAHRISRKKPSDLKFLHSVLFGRKGKDVDFKADILQFSGFVWHESDDKQKAKAKEKLDKCVKDTLLDLCWTRGISTPEANIRKEDIVSKLLDFIAEPHSVADSGLSDDQGSNSKKRKRGGESASKKVTKVKGESAEAVLPSKDDVRKTITEILKKVDFDTTTYIDIRKKLENHYKMDLAPKKEAIRVMIEDELT